MTVPPIQLGIQAFCGKQKLTVTRGALPTVQSRGVTPAEAPSFSRPPRLKPVQASFPGSFTGAPCHVPAVHSYSPQTLVFCKWAGEHLLMNDAITRVAHGPPGRRGPGTAPCEDPACGGGSVPGARFVLRQLCAIAVSQVLGSSWVPWMAVSRAVLLFKGSLVLGEAEAPAQDSLPGPCPAETNKLLRKASITPPDTPLPASQNPVISCSF